LTDDLENAQRKVADLTKKLRKVARRYAERDEEEDDGMPWELVKDELKALEKQRQEWEGTAAKLEARLAQQRAQLDDLEWLYGYCERMRARLAEANWDEQRTALEALAVRVTASGQNWHIDGIIPLERVPQEVAVVSLTCS
jgi:chromosome segregation ATPase